MRGLCRVDRKRPGDGKRGWSVSMPRGRSRDSVGGDATAEVEEGERTSFTKTNIPTDLLRTFVAICELGSFTKAANLFDLTQPAVSAHMRRLESIIGADLIEKTLSGVTLTECGEEVLRHARRMLAINDQIVSGGGPQPHAQAIRLGIPNLYATTKLARVLKDCGAAVGESRLQVRCDHSPGLVRSVRGGYLDLAAVLTDHEEYEDAVATWTDELVWVRARDLTL